MALFSNEADKNGRPETAAKPQAVSPLSPQRSPAPSAAAEHAPERKDSSACAYLDRSAKVNGKLAFEGAARIDGQVDGEISAGELTIGETAVVTATIAAASVIVAGTVKGEITAKQKLEIRPTARVSGEISAPKLVILEGAIFDGRCSMQPDGAREERDFSLRRKEKNAAQADGHAPSL